MDPFRTHKLVINQILKRILEHAIFYFYLHTEKDFATQLFYQIPLNFAFIFNLVTTVCPIL